MKENRKKKYFEKLQIFFATSYKTLNKYKKNKQFKNYVEKRNIEIILCNNDLK